MTHQILICISAIFLGLQACSTKTDKDQSPVIAADTVAKSYLLVSYSDGWDTLSYPRQPQSWFRIRRQETLSLDGFGLEFQPASAGFEPYYPDHKEREMVSRNFILPNEKSLAVENYLLHTLNFPFERQGDTLRFLWAKQPPWQLIDSPSQKYYVENFFPEKGFFLVKVYYSMGNSYLLLQRETGRTWYLWGRPYFSPSGDLMMVIHNDQQIQYSANGLQLFQINGDSLRSLWELGIANWGPAEASWKDDSSMLLKREYPAANESEEVYISDEVLLILQPQESAAF